MQRVPTISNAEWEVMKVIWDRPSATAAQVVAQLAGHKAWKEGTVKTLLNRLVKKGVLEFEAQGKSYIYRAVVSRKSVVRQESQSFLHRVFGGEAGAMLVHLTRSARLSDDEIAELRKILNSKREE